ncbi:hypothetical protein [Deinococcus sp. DB0503]|uniref:hypothetical protein n=1 Tax=Deinococcus sp. DB0503 TaxID=2479203 RepID=UPI0018DF7F2F|nr:hypothetical protein [Deinococcus sp. DB0503]MBI0445388.1 hypothetical protein [Deinococcus sp. DB0503]
MFRRPRLTFLLLLPGFMAACTGTDEGTLPTRLAVLTDGGATLRSATTGSGTVTPPTEVSVGVDGGVSLETLPGAKRVALTRRAAIESRDANFADVQPFAPTGFATTCLIASVMNAPRDRLLTLSQCPNGPQQLALYRVGTDSTNGTLVWTALLPVFTPPANTSDVPPIRLALTRENVTNVGVVDIGVVARPALAGGSEVIRVAPEAVGNTTAVASTPVPTPAIRDLAPAANGVIYAATDTGIQPLSGTGVPNGAATLTAFGKTRFDRLWTSASSGTSGNLFAAWRDTALSGNSSEPLRLWNGTAGSSAVTVAYIPELRDVTIALDGYLYALTRTALTRYDTVRGFQQGYWSPENLLSGLKDARAVAWLVP